MQTNIILPKHPYGDNGAALKPWQQQALPTIDAADLNAAYRAADDAANTALEKAVQFGQMLIEFKNQIPHGQWGEFIRERCEFSARTATRYMRIAKQPRAAESVRQAEKAISETKFTRNAVIDRIKDLADEYPSKLQAANEIIEGLHGDARLNRVESFGIDLDSYELLSASEKRAIRSAGVAVSDDHAVLVEVLGSNVVDAVVREVVGGPHNRRLAIADEILAGAMDATPEDRLHASMYRAAVATSDEFARTHSVPAKQSSEGVRFTLQGDEFTIVAGEYRDLAAVREDGCTIPLDGLGVMPIDRGSLHVRDIDGLTDGLTSSELQLLSIQLKDLATTITEGGKGGAA